MEEAFSLKNTLLSLQLQNTAQRNNTYNTVNAITDSVEKSLQICVCVYFLNSTSIILFIKAHTAEMDARNLCVELQSSV